MTRPIKASENGLEPHYKVRVVLPNALLHLASRDEPRVERDVDGVVSLGLAYVFADWIADEEYGDTIGYIDWPSVTAITWRWSG
jgi:hypothetical protein